MAGISESVLSDRLSELTRAGVIDRVVHDGPPVSVTYRLTACGEALVPALRALSRWAQESLPATGTGTGTGGRAASSTRRRNATLRRPERNSYPIPSPR